MERNKFSSEHIKNGVLTLTSEYPSSEDNFESRFQANISPYNQSSEQLEEELIEFNGKQQMEPSTFSSEQLKNEVLTITSEHPSSKDNFERKFQSKLSPSNQFFEQPEEELIEFEGKQQMEPNKFSQELIENEVLTLTSETSSPEDCFETKLQDKFDTSDQNFEPPEEELMDFMEQKH